MPFPNIGPGELIIILVIALVVLGPGKLPDVAASLGKSLREFRKAASDVTDAAKIDAPLAAPTPVTARAMTADAAPTPTPMEAAAANTLSGPAEPNTLKGAAPTSDQHLS